MIGPGKADLLEAIGRTGSITAISTSSTVTRFR